MYATRCRLNNATARETRSRLAQGCNSCKLQLIVTAYEALMNRLHGNPEF